MFRLHMVSEKTLMHMCQKASGVNMVRVSQGYAPVGDKLLEIVGEQLASNVDSLDAGRHCMAIENGHHMREREARIHNQATGSPIRGNARLIAAVSPLSQRCCGYAQT